MQTIADYFAAQLYGFERGDYSPSVTLALKIAKICQVTVEDIFEYKEDENDEE